MCFQGQNKKYMVKLERKCRDMFSETAQCLWIPLVPASFRDLTCKKCWCLWFLV